MSYSIDSFYDVTKSELLSNEAIIEFFDSDEMGIMLSFMKKQNHFERIGGIFFPLTPYGEFVDILECVLTDLNHRRGEENLAFAMKVSIYLMEDIVRQKM